jgi:hypothetical protein
MAGFTKRENKKNQTPVTAELLNKLPRQVSDRVMALIKNKTDAVDLIGAPTYWDETSKRKVPQATMQAVRDEIIGSSYPLSLPETMHDLIERLTDSMLSIRFSTDLAQRMRRGPSFHGPYEEVFAQACKEIADELIAAGKHAQRT